LRKKRIDPSVFLLAAIALLLALGVAAAVYTLRSDPVEEALSGDRVINALFVIEQDQRPLGTYVLMYYPATMRAAVFDIPGELGLLITRINRVDRIDRVYTSGRISGFENEIENLLGIDISFSLVLTMENLGRAVDMIEGVELFIPSPVESRGEDKPALFPSGKTRLDGDKAVMYVQYESPDEDKDMAVFRRQHFFLGFLKRQGEKNETLKNPAAARLYHSFFQTSMSRRTQIRLFDEFAAIDTDRTSIQSVEGTLREVSDQMLLLPSFDGSLIKDIVRQTQGMLTRQSDSSMNERFTVEVLNGTTRSGFAARTAELLRSFGFDVVSIGNADHSGYEKTQIIDRSGYDNAAKTLADIIRCGNISVETPARDNPEAGLDIQNNIEYRSDFTLIIGRDFDGRYVTGN
jgi:anionic cell wall polymer biosynthesis LytR-Cps2A-Psr (LCP) family protein